MAGTALDLGDLNAKLDWQNQDYWLHIEADTKLNKYPAKQHARAVATKLGVTTGLVLLVGEKTVLLKDSDQPVPFRQRRYFYYLTGCNESDCYVSYDIEADLLTLYIPKVDLRHAVWGGAGSTKAEAYAKYDVDVVRYTSELSIYLQQWAGKRLSGRFHLLEELESPDDGTFMNDTLRSKLKGKIDITDLKSAIELCRVIKYPHEIQLIRRANEISAQAHRAVLENIRDFKNERQIEGIFLDTCISAGAHNQAYSVIAGAGPNAAVLHYVNNNDSLEGKQLVLLDAGAEFDCYASDVTRTFPISGTWSKEAKDIYDAVCEMQTECIARIKPGVHFRDLQVLATTIATRWLLSLGILHNGTLEEILKAGTPVAFFPHGLGHHVGLEVHDVLHVSIQSKSTDQISPADLSVYKDTELDGFSQAALQDLYRTLIDPKTCMTPVTTDSPVLEEGMVVTVEPGIYFSDFALSKVYLCDPKHAKFINRDVLAKYLPVGGVRIEDDILVTKDGHENLTTAPEGEEALKIIRGDTESVHSAAVDGPFSPSIAAPCTSRCPPAADKGKAPMRNLQTDSRKILSAEVDAKYDLTQLTVEVSSRCPPVVEQKTLDILPPGEGNGGLINAFPFRNQTRTTSNHVGCEDLLLEVLETQEQTQALLAKINILQSPMLGKHLLAQGLMPLQANQLSPEFKRAFRELRGAQTGAHIKANQMLMEMRKNNASRLDIGTTPPLYNYPAPRMENKDIRMQNITGETNVDRMLSMFGTVMGGIGGVGTDHASRNRDVLRLVRMLLLRLERVGLVRRGQDSEHFEFVKPTEPASSTLPVPPSEEEQSPPPAVLVRTLYNFDGEGDPNCLNFRKEQRIQVVEKTDSGWWLGRLQGSMETIGWFPSNYVTEVPSVAATPSEESTTPAPTPAPAPEAASDQIFRRGAQRDQATNPTAFAISSIYTTAQRLRFSEELAALLHDADSDADGETRSDQIKELLEANNDRLTCFPGVCMQLRLLRGSLDFAVLPGHGMEKFRILYRKLDECLKAEFRPGHVIHRVDSETKDALNARRWEAIGVKEELSTDDMGICGSCQTCRVGFAQWDETWLAENDDEEEDDE